MAKNMKPGDKIEDKTIFKGAEPLISSWERSLLIKSIFGVETDAKTSQAATKLSSEDAQRIVAKWKEFDSKPR